VTRPADLGVSEASALLARGELSSAELVDACLARIDERDGRHSHDGDSESINAWVRVYAEDARAEARAADARRAAGDAPALCGVPVGLKDLYAVAGKPLTASSRLLHEVPDRDCDVWARLRAEGMVLLGHLHTHEFAVGGTTDQVGNPWALDRSAGGSSGGSGAALAARMVPAATGTDTAGSLRIPSARCGTSTIKPTRGLVSLRGIVPLSPSLDHAGPMARSVEDCALLLRAMAGLDPGRGLRARPLAGLRFALSPRDGGFELDEDTAAGFDGAVAAVRALGGVLVDPPPPGAPLDVGRDFLDVLRADLLVYHRRFDDRREGYRPSLREWVESGEREPVSGEGYAAAQVRRGEAAAAWADWFAEHGVFALLEPTIPVVARPRGDGYEHAGTDRVEIALTHYWNWIGVPAVALPASLGRRTGLPTSVSLIGPAGTDWALLEVATTLQSELGVPAL
jgi:aspartyl-tRNA(Asn)/glutamyl-tRNA(Gln) amidotransferase subunit A